MKKTLIIMIGLFLLLYIVPLGFRPMFNPDETRYAEIAREMILNHDYVTPTLNGVRYFEKPVMGYWIFAGSMKVFGENAFALRLPVALAAGLTAWIVFLLVSRFAGGQKIGVLAAGIYLSMPLVVAMGFLGILDGIFTFFLTACIGLFAYAILDEGGWIKKVLLLFLAGLFAGAAFLTKGFLAFALPALIAVGYLCWERRWKELLILPWIPLIGALLVILPWAAAVHQAQPDYWHYFVVVEHIQRFLGGAEAQHAESPFYFIPVLLGGSAQWILLFPAVLFGIKELGFKNQFLRFSLCWFVLPFLFFSISSGKLASYLLPCFAPLSVLFAAGLYKYIIADKRKIEVNLVAMTLAIGFLIALIGLAINHFTGFPVGEKLYAGTESWKWLLVTVIGALWGLSMLAVYYERNLWWKVIFFFTGFIPVIFIAQLVIPNQIYDRKAPSVFLRQIIRDLPADEPLELVSFRHPFQAVCWEFNRSDIWMIFAPGEIRYGLEYEDSRHRLIPSVAEFTPFLETSREAGKGVLLVLPANIYEEEREKLPKPRWVRDNADPKGYVVLKY